MIKLWIKFTDGLELTHNPLDDAKYQARIFINLINTINEKS